MREKINRLAKGIVDSENPEIIWMPSVIEEVIHIGETIKKELLIASGNHLNIKGLVYSTNRRVKIGNYAFGGLRNHISYEVNPSFLEYGDRIDGFFYLITNSGEKKIPYSFRIEMGVAGQILEAFQTLENFAEVVRKDTETALRLFGYREFTEAPFMQDIHIRTLYDGLKDRGTGRHVIEEFLVATGAKKPIEIQFPQGKREYRNPKEELEENLSIRKIGWGYVKIDLYAEGDFIKLSNSSITDADFKNGIYEANYRILPSYLHKGRNFGRITLVTTSGTSVIEITVQGSESADCPVDTRLLRQERYRNYLQLRLDYTLGGEKDLLILEEMLKESERLRNENGSSNLLSFMMSELFYLMDRTDKACLVLDECKNDILAARKEQPENYCIYQYLSILIYQKEGEREFLVHLLEQYVDEGTNRLLLFLLLLKLDPTRYDNPGTLLVQMKQLYAEGSSSPFLYLEACKLYLKDPQLLHSVDGFDLHALYFGAKNGFLNEEMALRISNLANGAKHFHRLCYRLLITLYDKYPQKDLLSAICCMLIKGNCRASEYFLWYEAGLLAGISLTRLYEYYLYALPAGYDRLLPQEILLYFSYDKELDQRSKSVLYRNILKFLKPETAIYKEYERDIEQFAMEQLFESRLDHALAVIYDHMIYKDMIDVPVAKVLPAILRSYRIECKNKAMKYVIVCHEELIEEDAFPLKEGIAYVPLFSEHHILLFQDAYGNRYTEIRYLKTLVMDQKDLEKKCFEVYPDHQMLRLKACREIIDHGVENEKQALILERALEDLKLYPLYRKTMMSQIISYYRNQIQIEAGVSENSDSSYLLHLDKQNLSGDERTDVCETLIIHGYIKETYDIIKRYGSDHIEISCLQTLCTRMILLKLFDEDELLLYLSYHVFESGECDSVILDYLCEHYNGTSEQMYLILSRGITAHVETYDLEERLLAQILFTGCLDHVDEVFELYISRKKIGESLVKAYFTAKSTKYFFEDKPEKSQVFVYLEGALHGTIEKDKVPVIYLMALTKYYATLSELSEEQKQVCSSSMDILLETGMVFPYFKELSQYTNVPDDILDKAMVQYIGRRDSKIELQVRVLPEEENFHGEDIKRVYHGIFVKQKVLFEGETMEYQIYEYRGEQRMLVSDGSVTCKITDADSQESRFSCLNTMGISLNGKDEENLKKKMNEYLIKNAAVEELFTIE